MFTSAAKRRHSWNPLILGVLCCAVMGGAQTAHTAVIVFSNESPRPVTFIVGDSPEDKASQKAYKIIAGDVLSLPVDESKASQKIAWFDAEQNVKNTPASTEPRDIQSMTLKLNSIYAFTGDSTLELKHRFSVDAASSSDESKQTRPIAIDAVVTVPIMILVDDDEPRRREIWERELRERVEQASDIFEQACRIRFEIAKIGTWETDDRTTDFDKTLAEFQQKVKPEPGIALAIGFTSQYEVQTKGRFHMGGTRGPLFPYILIREWSQHVGKPERLELLVHELGHVFGATHTPNQKSVMRPVVGDNRSNAKSFRIGFDPLNTLVVYLFCEPLRLDGVRSLRQLSPEVRSNLMSVYHELGQRFPDDSSAAMYQAILQRSKQIRFRPSKQAQRPTKVDPLVASRYDKLLPEATRVVVRLITLQASQLEASEPGQRFDQYVQAAAKAVEKLPPELASKAMLLGLGITLDSSGTLRQMPGFQETYDQIVPPEQSQRNHEKLGTFSLRGNADWARRFAAVLGESALVTPAGAEAAAINAWWKSSETKKVDLHDMVIDIAATTLAAHLLSGRLSPATLSENFDAARYLPNEVFFKALPEPLDQASLEQLYGNPTDPRFLKFKESVRQAISVPASPVGLSSR